MQAPRHGTVTQTSTASRHLGHFRGQCSNTALAASHPTISHTKQIPPMWDIPWVTDVPRSSSPSSLSMHTAGRSLQSHTLQAVDITKLPHTLVASNTSHHSTGSTSHQSTVCAPGQGPHLALQFSTGQLHSTPPVNALGFVSYHCLPLALQESRFHSRVMSGTPNEPAAFDSTLPSSPYPAAMPSSGHGVDFRHQFSRACSACPPNRTTSDPCFHHERLYPSAGATGFGFSQSPETLRNRVTHRHQRLAASHPYSIPPPPSNRVDPPPPTQLLPRTEGVGNAAPGSPGWRLTLDTYEWLFAVMYPKRRSDKKRPTPSGSCQLCDSTCKRAGILQQHVTILHRQRLARKHLAGKPYDLQLALAFVVAQVVCDVVVHAQSDAVQQESQAFLAALRNSPAGLNPLMSGVFPSLQQKLDEFSRLESWVGMQCQFCGMWATRPVALAEHAVICNGAKRTPELPGPAHGFKEPMRLTASGLAARPSRGAPLDR